MTQDDKQPDRSETDAIQPGPPGRKLSPAAERALAEADARRKARDAAQNATEKEIGGRGGPDPARYGDWEIDGRAIDF
jgi:hypothetical protein